MPGVLLFLFPGVASVDTISLSLDLESEEICPEHRPGFGQNGVATTLQEQMGSSE